MSDIIDVGFAEECEAWRLESRFFPSKIGGKPAWLDLQNIPNAEQLKCDYCENPCIFLCQVYAPYEEDPKAFHRTIYVFICKNPECCKENSNGNIKVIRSQLERSNEFYPLDPPVEDNNWRTDIICEKWSKTCAVCGIYSSSHCSKCKKVNYCCRTHQILDWKNGHKGSCGVEDSTSCTQHLFPEYELVIEREQYQPENKKDTSEEELKKFQDLVESGKGGTLQTEKDVDNDLLQMASELEDKTFLKFQERIKSEPDQVIRYNRGGSPLYISSTNQPDEIPRCDMCEGVRQFEFQVMPQLINYFKLEDVFNSIDWGILSIYTCKNSCTPQSKYIKEFVWKQDIIKEDKM